MSRFESSSLQSYFKPFEINQYAPTTTGTARGLWAAGTAELITMFTSSTQNSASQDYYYEVWGSASISCADEVMFSVAYGHVSGSGSINEGGEADDTPSRAVYSQYKLMCLDGDEYGFYLSGSTKEEMAVPLEDFYVININRDKFGDKMDPGNFEINIAELNGSGISNNVHTGSNVQLKANPKILTLIDDSGDTTDLIENATQTSYVRNLVSGSLQNGIYSNSDRHYYGKVFPSQGIILISAKSLNHSSSFNTVTGSNISGDNSYKLFTAMSGSAALNSMGFTARAIDIKHCSYYYCRIRNSEYNYTSNPTMMYQDGFSKGVIKNSRFWDNPITYITSIGLYGKDANGIDNQLLAVAKLSKPIKKSFTNELSVTIKLEYWFLWLQHHSY